MTPKIYMHKESGDLVISYPVYTRETCDNKDNDSYRISFDIECYLGDAVENKHGLTVIFPPSWKNAIFTEIGEL